MNGIKILESDFEEVSNVSIISPMVYFDLKRWKNGIWNSLSEDHLRNHKTRIRFLVKIIICCENISNLSRDPAL
jgi:hypothetical protein